MHFYFPALLALWSLSTGRWLLLWGMLAAITILLIVLLRTRWSQARPWRKCAILSLWVHVLLAFLATTVRIVTGAPETGSDEPIHVAVVSASTEQTEESKEEEVAPDWELPEDPAVVPPEPPRLELPALQEQHGKEQPTVEKLQEEQLKAEPEPPMPFEAPALAEKPTEANPTESDAPNALSPTPPSPVSDQLAAEQPSTESLAEEAPTEGALAAEPSPKTPATTTETPHESKQPLPETYTDRFSREKQQLAEQRGGSAQTERAVHAALGWLAEAQSDNGGWDASRFGAGEERVVLGHNRHGAGIQADTGVTGLALLAFLGAGYTHHSGPYDYEVARGLEYLRQNQRADGALCGDAQLFARMYCHSMATFAVCEAYAMTQDERLKPLARAAVDYTLSMQHPTDGGWRYRRGDTGDTSQLGWQLMTLKSAELADLKVPEITWTRVERFLRRVQRGSHGGLAAYRPEGPPSPTMTAEALFCRQLLRDHSSRALLPQELSEASQSITENLPDASRRNLYFWYYATLALYHNQLQSAEASEQWRTWNQALTTTLLTTQQTDGSWSADTVWGGYGGKVYTTALSVMCLEVYYRYKPEEEAGEFAQDWHAIQR